jgi:hypothetical protein
MTAGVLTVRERVTQAMLDRLKGINGGPTYTFDLTEGSVFDLVDPPSQVRNPYAFLLEMDETPKLMAMANRWECTLPILVWFGDQYTASQEEAPSRKNVLTKRFLADVQHAFSLPLSLELERVNGAPERSSIKVVETGNELNLSMPSKSIEGAIGFEIVYWRNRFDPTRL